MKLLCKEEFNSLGCRLTDQKESRKIKSKYVRVMDGLKSNAGGFSYKLDEINISEK